MVAGARGDHAAGALRGAEVRDPVVGAAQLEAEDRLQVLALEVHAVAQPRRQPRRGLERRFAGDVVDAAGQDPPEQRVEERRSGAGAGRRVLVHGGIIPAFRASHVSRFAAARPPALRTLAQSAVFTRMLPPAPTDGVAERSALPGRRPGLARSRRRRRRARHAHGRGAGARLPAAGRCHAAAVRRSACDRPGSRRGSAAAGVAPARPAARGGAVPAELRQLVETYATDPRSGAAGEEPSPTSSPSWRSSSGPVAATCCPRWPCGPNPRSSGRAAPPPSTRSPNGPARAAAGPPQCARASGRRARRRAAHATGSRRSAGARPPDVPAAVAGLPFWRSLRGDVVARSAGAAAPCAEAIEEDQPIRARARRRGAGGAGPGAAAAAPAAVPPRAAAAGTGPTVPPPAAVVDADLSAAAAPSPPPRSAVRGPGGRRGHRRA